MRITIQAKIERADGTRKTVEVLSLRKTADKVPASGLGLMLGEVRDLSAKLQRIFLEEQVAELGAAMSRCPQCTVTLPVKDAKNIVYRTAFGKAKLASPRLYSSCSSCGHKSHARNSFSPLAEALPARTNPQWVWLQTRYASAMSCPAGRRRPRA